MNPVIYLMNKFGVSQGVAKRWIVSRKVKGNGTVLKGFGKIDCGSLEVEGFKVEEKVKEVVKEVKNPAKKAVKKIKKADKGLI